MKLVFLRGFAAVVFNSLPLHSSDLTLRFCWAHGTIDPFTTMFHHFTTLVATTTGCSLSAVFIFPVFVAITTQSFLLSKKPATLSHVFSRTQDSSHMYLHERRDLYRQFVN